MPKKGSEDWAKLIVLEAEGDVVVGTGPKMGTAGCLIFDTNLECMLRAQSLSSLNAADRATLAQLLDVR